jgi:hypothetical protein
MHAPGSPTVITIPTTGTYLVGGAVRFAAHAQDQGQRQIGISVNGVPGAGGLLIADQLIHTSAGAAIQMGMVVNTVWEFTAADTIALVVWQNSGGTLAVSSLSAYSPEFWCFRIA